MTTQIFELEGCTKGNLSQVQQALASITGWTIHQTVKGAFLLRVEADLAVISQIQSLLNPLQLDPIRAVDLPAIVLQQ